MTNKDTADSFNSSPLKTAPKGKTHLLAIAIDDYKQCSKLNNAVLDVEAFIEVMTTRYTLEPQQVILIKNTEATKKRIESAFDELIDLVEPEDKLIIYFSGHGRHHEKRGGFWVPVEAGKGDKDWPDYISNAVIRDYLSKINSFHTFLIADSCFSGALLIDKSKEKFTGDRRDTERSRWALTSGKKEIVSDGQPGAHSPFAAALLDVLRKAEEPPSVMRICDLVLEKVAANAHQTPMGSPLRVEGHDAGQLVLYFRENEEAVWAAALAADTWQAYTIYYEQYPHGKYGDEALDKIAEWEEKAAWKLVRKDRLAEVLRYIRQNPCSPFIVEAQSLANKLKVGFAAPIVDLAPTSSIAQVPTPKIETPSLVVPEHMVFVKGGTFEMGDVMGDNESKDETVHTVTLSDFLIGKYAVTFDEYDQFCVATKREKPGDSGWGRGQHPVINVNWHDAIDYCNWRSKQEGLEQVFTISGEKVIPNWTANGYRLPTEAEWEYAARGGGKKVRFGNGKDVADPKEINFNGSKQYKKPYSITGEYRGKTVPVGSLNSPNALGLHDMSGNVWEWCWDWYGADYYMNSPAKDPTGPDQGDRRVLRGGSWFYDDYLCRLADRIRDDSTNRSYTFGLRLARHQISL